MQRQGNKPPKNKPGLMLNLVLLKLVSNMSNGMQRPGLNWV